MLLLVFLVCVLDSFVAVIARGVGLPRMRPIHSVPVPYLLESYVYFPCVLYSIAGPLKID